MTEAEVFVEREPATCPVCASQNPVGKRFCGDCGERLPLTCPGCGNLRSGGHHFCADCGSALPGWCPSCGGAVAFAKPYCCACGFALGRSVDSEPASSLAAHAPIEIAREERRLVTALFCDLAGFTPLSERLDAEQIRSLQAEYFERMSGEIARFGGKVEKFAGDAVLALFGVPVTHGDDAERALLCSIAMQAAMGPLTSEARDRWEVDLALRIGVNTGEAVGGVLDIAGHKDYSVTGDVLNTAARLQSAAGPGSVMAGEETMRLARKSIRFGERRDLTLKGKGRPVAAYQVLGTRASPSERRNEQKAQLVGRDHELSNVIEAWTRAQSNEGQLVTVVGDAGVGKSSLIAEAAGIAAPADGAVYWARALSYGQDISLYLVGDLVRSMIGASDQEGPESVGHRLDETIETLLAGQPDDVRAAAIDALREVLSLDESRSSSPVEGAQARRQVLVKSLRLVLLGLSQQEAAIVVLDDLQWIDSASAEVLSEIMTDVPALRLCVLAAHRSGWTAPWAEWTWIERLNLRPLKDRDATALARLIVGGMSVTSELDGYVAERACGNPYFIEELLHVLVETGGIALQSGQMGLVAAAAENLPSTLTEILLARLDALDDEARTLVQVASVIGRDFNIDLLGHVLGQPIATLESPLARLLRADIAVQTPGSRTEYAFKNVSMRDVAYHTLLSPRRRGLHRAIAHAILALYSADESVGVVAYHMSETEEHAEAAEWLERAGDRAAGVYANQAAIGHYDEARQRLKLSAAEPGSLPRIAEKLGGVFRTVAWYDEALEELESAAESYHGLSDLGAEARTVTQICEVDFLRGAPEQAIERAWEVLQRAELDEVEASTDIVGLYAALIYPLYALNRFEDALTAAGRALELVRSVGDDQARIEVTVRYGLALYGMGRLGEAQQVIEGIVTGAEAPGLSGTHARALSLLGDVALAQGRPLDARAYYGQAMTIAQDRGDVVSAASLAGSLGDAAFVVGEWDEARARYERAVDLVRSISLTHFSAATLMALGEQYLREGDAGRASRYLEEPFVIARRSGQATQIPRLEIPLAAWDLAEGRPKRALERLEPLIARPSFETISDHRPMQVAAEAYVQIGSEQRAEELIDRGMAFAESQGNRLAILGWLQVKATLAGKRASHSSAKQGEDAHDLFEKALDLARQIPYPYQEATTLYHAGMVHGTADYLIAAREIFRRLGALPDLARVDRALAAASDTAILT